MTVPKDYLSTCYMPIELHINDTARQLTQQLEAAGKSGFDLHLVDCIPADKLYGADNRAIVTDQQLFPRNTLERHVAQFSRTINGMYYMPENTWHRNITRDFNCFINRFDPVRQSWFYFLARENLLDQGYVSFLMTLKEEAKDWPNPMDYFDHVHNNYLTAFPELYEKVRPRLPFKNFVDTGNLCDTVLSSKFSLVLETYFERTDCITFSEKIFRALQLPRPWLLFHATGAVKILRDWGFYVFDDVVDHSYDDLDTTETCVPRQQAILNQIPKLQNLVITQSMLDHWEDKTRSNCKLLEMWYNNCVPDAERVLNETFQYCMEQ